MQNLIEGPVSRELPRFALPILTAGIVGWLSVSINAIWVGRLLGETALAAAANANIVVFQMIGLAFGLTNGSAVLIGRHIGAADILSAKRLAGTCFSFFALLSLAVLILGQLFIRPLLILLDVPGESLPAAISYARIIFLAVPTMYVFALLMAVVRGAGDSKTTARFTYLVAAIDVALNPLFILGAGPIPGFGIGGAALASLCANAIGVVSLLYFLYRRNHPVILRGNELSFLKIDPALVKDILRQGLPSSAQFLVYSLSATAMMSLVNRLGVETSAAYGAAMQVWNYLQMPTTALGAGVSIMAAQNIGAGRWDRVQAIVRIGVAYSMLAGAVLVVLSNLASAPIFALFFPQGAPSIAIARHIQLIVSPGFILFGAVEAMFGALRAARIVKAPLTIMAVILFGIRIPAAAVLMDRIGPAALWWSFPFSAAAAAVLAFGVYRYHFARLMTENRSAAPDAAPGPG